MTVRLCEISAVAEGAPLLVDVDGFPPLAVYRAGSHYFVTDDTCTHSNASLSEGEQEGSTIVCPVHEGAFDLETGEAVGFPCTVALKTYKAVLKDGGIWI